MPAVRPSVVIDAMIDVARRIEAVTWPIHPVTQRRPKVGAGLEKIETPDEWIDIASRSDDNSSIEWVLTGGGSNARRDERFWVDIQLQSTVPGASRIAALSRINELKAIVEGLFINDDGSLTPVGDGEDWAVDLGGPRQVVARATRTDQGWTADAIVSVAVAARI